MVRRCCRAWELQMFVFAAICFYLETSIGVVHGQTAGDGSITIDCGSSEMEQQFIDTGVNSVISDEYKKGPEEVYRTLRSFPNGTRNCYTLVGSTKGTKYVITAGFLYGNYDGTNKPPIFELHIGTNYWTTVKTPDEDDDFAKEIITVALRDNVQVCLVDIQRGTPFISLLTLVPLKHFMYPTVNQKQSLNLYNRTRLWGKEEHDTYNRTWEEMKNPDPSWKMISQENNPDYVDDDAFLPPIDVMQHGISPPNGSTIYIKLTPETYPQHPNTTTFYLVLHFFELEYLNGSNREFNVFINDVLWNSKSMPFSPKKTQVSHINDTLPPTNGPPSYNITIEATQDSQNPPILSALEFFSQLTIDGVMTEENDASAMASIKQYYSVKIWQGDPCLPANLSWDGLNCSDPILGAPKIIVLNMSNMNLFGIIAASFENLSSIQTLDLSRNNLRGQIPEFLSHLPFLQHLDLSGNCFQGKIPDSLQQKMAKGSLNLRTEEYDRHCSGDNKKRKKLVKVLIPVAIILILVVAFIAYRTRRYLKAPVATRGGRTEDTSGNMFNYRQQISLSIENRQFTHQQLAVITNDFQSVIGEGGFGKVYHGLLEDGTHVAVKITSKSYHNMAREFIAEANHLTRVHHMNLVQLIGYCKDVDCLALVYEYMEEGNLQEHLRGKFCKTRPLAWKERLRIVLEAAEGLEYLHKACNPPLIHRDVKTSNILLNANLQAKVADFGLSKAFDPASHVSTSAVVGTPGYIDPEYQATLLLTEKSDVYSFGVILLEIITGKPPIVSISWSERVSLILWVRQRLARGNIESVIDPGMQGSYDINSVWKVADIGLKCTEGASRERLTMTEVVMHLKQCMELEEASHPDNDYSAGPGTGTLEFTNSSEFSSGARDRSPKKAAEAQSIGPSAR